MPETHVLVMGASGGVGRHAVALALARGHKVRAFARHPERSGLDHAKLEKRRGNARDPADVTAALEGIDVVIQVLGVPANPDMVLKPVNLFSHATRILVPAMQAAGIRRLISVTGFGAGDSRSRIGCLQWIPFRIILGRAYDDKDIQEALIRSSDLDWVIVRPGILTNGPHSGRYQVLTEPAHWRNGMISRADVADFLVDQVDNDSQLGRTPVLVY